MNDVATRTYQRSFETQRANGVLDGPVEEVQLARGNHRYSSAYAHLRANPGGKVVELGYGTTTLVPILAALGGIVFLSEPPNVRLVLAAVVILGGIALVILEKK